MHPGQPNEMTGLKVNQILMRRSTRVFVERQPREGVAGNIATFCCSLIFSLILLAVVNALSIALIVVGIIYLDKENCPGEANIAPVIIASGVLAIFLSIFEGRSRLQVAKDGQTVEEKRDCCYWLLNLTRLVKTGLFIYLCVLVFRLLPHVQYVPYRTDPGMPNYFCNPNLFLFVYWTIILVFVISSFIILTFCCCCCCIAFAAAVNA